VTDAERGVLEELFDAIADLVAVRRRENLDRDERGNLEERSATRWRVWVSAVV
jgi:hypothetical protein